MNGANAESKPIIHKGRSGDPALHELWALATKQRGEGETPKNSPYPRLKTDVQKLKKLMRKKK